jgi:membrane protein required for colicin V production
MTGLGGIDRILGLAFGFLRGGVVVMVLVLAAGLTKFPQLPMWQNAMLSPFCVAMAKDLMPWLPPSLAEKIQY